MTLPAHRAPASAAPSGNPSGTGSTTPGPPPAAGPTPPGWGPPRRRTVTWYDPATVAAGMAGRSGLEFLRAMRDGLIPPPPISSLFAMWAIDVEHGRVSFGCRPEESAYNPIGLVHGGLVCTLADSVAGCSVQSTLPAGVAYTSLDITVNYLRPVTAGSGVLVATGRLVKPGRKVAHAAVDVVDGNDKLVATATSNLLIL